MARSGNQTGAAWVQDLGESLGQQLGEAIAASMQRTLQATINIGEIAARLGAGGRKGRRGRPPASGSRAICSVAGCGKPVLAKGICRSHYYKTRYKLQKAGKLVTKARKNKGDASADKK